MSEKKSSHYNVVSELSLRGLFYQSTDYTKINRFDGSTPEKILTAYIGFDLTAPALHFGSLATLISLYHFVKSGHNAIIVLGGGTTFIGDPSGKTETRKMLGSDIILQNKVGICNDVLRIMASAFAADDSVDPMIEDWILDAQKNCKYDCELVFEVCGADGCGKLTIVDNYYWLKSFNYMDFLIKVGSCFSINRLIKMDTFEQRLKDQSSLSFVEFNYPLLQAYDFYYLHIHYGCNMQIGGSDQWGNIIQGIDLIGKLKPDAKVFGVTVPLVVTLDGKKMGKTESGAVWLSSKFLDDIAFYQYVRNLSFSDSMMFYMMFIAKSEDIMDWSYKFDFVTPFFDSTSFMTNNASSSGTSIGCLLPYMPRFVNPSSFFEIITIYPNTCDMYDTLAILIKPDCGLMDFLKQCLPSDLFTILGVDDVGILSSTQDLLLALGLSDDSQNHLLSALHLDNKSQFLPNTLRDDYGISTAILLRTTMLCRVVSFIFFIGGLVKKRYGGCVESKSAVCDFVAMENSFKSVVSFDITALVRGTAIANSVAMSMRSMFCGKIDVSSAIECENGVTLVSFIVFCGLSNSKSDARRVIESRGVKINDVVATKDTVLSKDILLSDFGVVSVDNTPLYTILSVGKTKKVTMCIR